MKRTIEATDDMLVRQYLEGDNAAFDTLLLRYESKVYTYISYCAGGDEDLAQDLFQDCFMRIIYKLQNGSYRESHRFACWLMRVAHNFIIDYHRSLKNNPFVSESELGYDTSDILSYSHTDTREYELINEQLKRDVRYLISRLPENQRDVVRMHFYEDMTFREIAQATHVSINTALGRMRYALNNMRRMAREDGFDLAI